MAQPTAKSDNSDGSKIPDSTFVETSFTVYHMNHQVCMTCVNLNI